MSLEVDIATIQYPQVDGTVIRSEDGAVVSVSGHYNVGGSTDEERQENLEVEMFKRGKIALADYDRQKKIDDEYKEIQKSVDPIENSKIQQPTAPTAPSLKAEANGGKLEVAGVADTATVKIVVNIVGQGEPSTKTETQTDEDGNETEVEVDNTVRINFTQTITTGLPDYAVEIDQPTIEVNITSTAYNKIDDEAEATTTWTPASEGE
jgi:hypothetical protein